MSPAADSGRLAIAAGCVWLALAAPPIRAVFEASMTVHMLAQLPLLAVLGWMLGRAWAGARAHTAAARVLRGVQSFNAGGLTGIIVASFVMVLWMLPRLLDLARLDVSVDAIKYLSVPAAGVAVALSWPRLPVIARGVVHLEVIATFFRFGWGYAAAEEQLCLTYLAGDQQRAGALLLWLGAAYSVAIAWRPLFGQPWRRRSAEQA